MRFVFRINEEGGSSQRRTPLRATARLQQLTMSPCSHKIAIPFHCHDDVVSSISRYRLVLYALLATLPINGASKKTLLCRSSTLIGGCDAVGMYVAAQSELGTWFNSHTPVLADATCLPVYLRDATSLYLQQPEDDTRDRVTAQKHFRQYFQRSVVI